MTNTNELITHLAKDAAPSSPLASPRVLFARMLLVFMVYFAIALPVMGLREDITLQLSRSLFLAEIFTLAAISISALWALVHLAFPDQYQHRLALHAPLMTTAMFALLFAWEMTLPPEPHAFIPAELEHHFICTLCIVGVAIIPSALMFWLTKQGATARPRLAGFYAMLAAASIGCLLMRLIEQNDDPLHLLTYHYAPTLAFAALGAWVGRRLLRW